MVTDIAPVEARHASNREMAQMQTRGWFPSLHTLSAKFISSTVGHLQTMAENARQAFNGTGTAGGKRQKQKDNAGTETQKAARARKGGGGGGAFRAFCSAKSGGVKFTAETLRKLGEQYRSLSEEEKDFYRRVGAAATISHKEGFSSFTKRTRTKTQDPLEVHAALCENSDNAPLPGLQLPNGAIVAANTDWDLQVAITYTGSDSFTAQYQVVKDMAHQERKVRMAQVELTSEETMELQRFEGSSVEDSFMKELMNQNMDEAANGFLRTSASGGRFISFQWIPPISRAVKAGMANGICTASIYQILDSTC